MDYLTNYYKNLCEELQAKENNLRKIIYEMAVLPPPQTGPYGPPPIGHPQTGNGGYGGPKPADPGIDPDVFGPPDPGPSFRPPQPPSPNNPNYERLYERWIRDYQRWWNQQTPEFRSLNPNLNPVRVLTPK